jgi:hypothetical protein
MLAAQSRAQDTAPAAARQDSLCVVIEQKAIRALPVTIGEYNQFLADIRSFWHPGFQPCTAISLEKLRQQEAGHEALYQKMLPENSLIPDSAEGLAYHELVPREMLIRPARKKIEYYIFMKQIQHAPVPGLYPHQAKMYCRYKTDLMKQKNKHRDGAKTTCRPMTKADWESLHDSIPMVPGHFGQKPEKNGKARLYYYTGYTEMLGEKNSIHFPEHPSLQQPAYNFTTRGYPDMLTTFRYVLEWGQ